MSQCNLCGTRCTGALCIDCELAERYAYDPVEESEEESE